MFFFFLYLSLLLPLPPPNLFVCVCLCLYLFRLGWARTKQAREQHHLSDELLTDAVFLKFPKHAIKRACIWCITWFSGEEEGLWTPWTGKPGDLGKFISLSEASGSSTAKWEKDLMSFLGPVKHVFQFCTQEVLSNCFFSLLLSSSSSSKGIPL